MIGTRTSVRHSRAIRLPHLVLTAMVSVLLCWQLSCPVTALAAMPPKVLDTWNDAIPPVIVDPTDVAVDGQGLIYVLDRANTLVVKYLSDGTPLAMWGDDPGTPGNLFDPMAIAVDKERGEVYVADSGLRGLHVFDTDGVLLRQWAHPYWTLEYPKAIEISDGYIYILASTNPDISSQWTQMVKYDRDTFAPVASFSGDSGTGDYELDWPHDVAVDGQGRVYVADRANSRIQIFDLDLQYIETWDEYNGGMIPFSEPMSVAVDAQGNVFVGEDDRIVKVGSNGELLSECLDIRDVMGLDVYGCGTVYATNTNDQEVVRLGYPAHTVIVSDVPDDQGGWVRVSWANSELDRLGQPFLVTDYLLYRRNDQAKTFEGWDVVATIPARGERSYQVVVPTLADSTVAAGDAWSVFVVSAMTDDRAFWDAAPDSGYSLDNIAPGVPLGIMAGYRSSGVSLEWDDAPEADFQHHRVYRSTDPGFIPAPGNLVQKTATSAWTDHIGDPWDYYYKVTTLDHAGNESEAAAPSSVVGVDDGALPSVTALLGAYPNPFNPSTTLSFELASPAHARLKIYDTAGRLVATLVDEQRVDGRHDVVWDGRNAIGQSVASGVYLYRLEVSTTVQTGRMTLVK
ncbi:MAG: T9SS type A sorting domain-containing protein [bacterium]|nr:T9SS type A sorting domain-containing protein [bacterium]